jgi:hypothetical protein
MRFLESLKWPANTKGRATIAVKECEGQTSKFKLDVSGGRAQVAPSDASPDLELTDKDWAAIACGDLTATSAAQLGVIYVSRTDALSLLDALSVGPAPFCAEYF